MRQRLVVGGKRAVGRERGQDRDELLALHPHVVLVDVDARRPPTALAACRRAESASEMLRYPGPRCGNTMSCIEARRHAHQHPQPVALRLDQDLHEHVGGHLVGAGRRGRAQDEDEDEQADQAPRRAAAEGGGAEAVKMTTWNDSVHRRVDCHYTFGRRGARTVAASSMASTPSTTWGGSRMNRKGNLIIGVSLLALIVACGVGQEAVDNAAGAPANMDMSAEGLVPMFEVDPLYPKNLREPLADGPDHRRGRRLDRHGLDRPPEHARPVRGGSTRSATRTPARASPGPPSPRAEASA